MALEFKFNHPPERVFALLCDPDFLVDRCLDLGELSAECEVDEQGKTTVISLNRERKQDLPAFLARVFDPVQQMSMEECWQQRAGSYLGSYTLQVDGQPVTISAEMSLKKHGKGGALYHIEHQAKARIPLLGKRIEKFILSQAHEGARDELQYLADSLE